MLYNPFDSIQPNMGSMLDTMPFSELSLVAIARGESGGSNNGGVVGVSSGVGGGGAPHPSASGAPPPAATGVGVGAASSLSDDVLCALFRSEVTVRSERSDSGSNASDRLLYRGQTTSDPPPGPSASLQPLPHQLLYQQPTVPHQAQTIPQVQFPNRTASSPPLRSPPQPVRHSPSPPRRRQQHHHHGNNELNSMTIGEVDIRRVITESQAAHAAHTRRQVDDDIQFRRALEIASIQSRSEDELQFESQMERAIADSRRLSNEHAHHGRRPSQQDGEDDLVRMISEQSIRDEEERQRSVNEKYQVELEVALKQSEHLEEENKRRQSSEEELIQKVLEQTRREMEEARITEHEMMQRVMRESLESQEEGKKGGVDDEMLEEVLKMSLEEKQRQASSAEEEAEQIRKAMEWSMYDF